MQLRLNPPQSRAMRVIRDGMTVTLAFGRGVGKSWFVRRIAYLLIAQWEYRERKTPDGTISGVRIVFLLPTFKQFRDVHSRALLRELGEDFAFLGGKVDGTTFTVTFHGGSSIQVFPASEHGGQRARGIRADVVILDEADDIDGSVFDEVISPWFTEPWSLKIKIASGTPKRGRHGLLFRLHEAGRKGDRIRGGQLDGFKPDEIEALRQFHTIHATYRDAPENVDRRSVELAKVTMPLASFEREFECNFDSGEGLVYQFDEAFHVKDPPALTEFREFIVGVDHGWTDAGVMLLIGIQGHGEDAVAWVLKEHYETQVPAHVWDARALEWRSATFWADPSRPDRINSLKSLGLNAPALPADVKPILAGISRVADMLFRRKSEDGSEWSRLYIAPVCVNLIRELGTYRWKRLPDGSFDENPEDRFNHACLAAGTPVVTSRGEVPIEAVVTGDHVMTRAGWRAVVASGLTRRAAALWQLNTSAGVVLGTADHLVWTENRGWVRLDSLRYNDILVSWANTDDRFGFGSTGSGLGGTRTRRIQTSPSIFDQAAYAAAPTDTYIGRYGNQSTDRSPRVTMSIIETSTRSITTRQILSAYRNPSTTRSMSMSGPRSEERPIGNSSPEFGRSPSRGTARQLGANGIASTGETCSPIASHGRVYASSAAAGTQRARLAEHDFAVTAASPHGGGQPESMIKKEAARVAGRLSGSTNIGPPSLVPVRVLSVRATEQRSDVFNLEVDGEHEFFAAGVLVHNCDSLRYALAGRFGRPPNTRHEASGR